MRYPVVIFKDPDSIYGIVVPDLPGCITAADTVEQVLTRAVEAIKCHMSGMLIDGEPIPEPKDIASHQDNPEYADALQWDTVTITMPELRHYPVLIYPARYRHYRLIVPDLPGCTARGKTAREAHAKAGLAIEQHMESMVLKDREIPQPKTIAQHRETPAYPDGQWVSVPVIVPELEHLRIARPGRIPRFFRWLGYTRYPWEPRPKPRIRGARPSATDSVLATENGPEAIDGIFTSS